MIKKNLFGISKKHELKPNSNKSFLLAKKMRQDKVF